MKKKGIRVPGIGHRYNFFARVFLQISNYKTHTFKLSIFFEPKMLTSKALLASFCKRIKRGDNRDKRVELLQQFSRTHFPSVKYMEYAVQVETYTLSKANNLVLNVDGAIGTLFLDLLAGSGMFTKPEIDEIVEIGYLNGLFVLARSIGLIG